MSLHALLFHVYGNREPSGLMVEHQTLNQEVLGSVPTRLPCCVLEQDN